MKKWILSLVICILLLVSYIYFIIPNYILLNNSATISVTKDGLYRSLTNIKKWEQWWPGNYQRQEKDLLHKKFLFNNSSYVIDDIQISSIIISITKNNSKIETRLDIFPKEKDEMNLLWTGKIYTTTNPITRLQTNRDAREINKDIDNILKKIKSFFSKDENIYGTSIHKEHVIDSILVYKNSITKGFPKTNFIYGLINDLKTYIIANSAHETGFPMLNVTTVDKVNYLVKVAIPIDKKLPSHGNISYKWMFGGGNILMTEVKGDNASIDTALIQLENYIDDYKLATPAIPYQSLITNRSKEPDSSKWVTRIYYPVGDY